MFVFPSKHYNCLNKIVVTIFFIILLQGESKAKNILFLSFVSTTSHQNIYLPLLLQLAKRDHNVTLVTPIKTGKTVPNFHEINTPSVDKYIHSLSQSVFDRRKLVGIRGKLQQFLSMPFLLADKYAAICRQSYEDPQIKHLIANAHKKEFDLVFLKTFQNECTYGLAHYLNTSTILVTTTAPFRWNVEAFGGFDPPSFVPSFGMPFTDRMNFAERTLNLISELVIVSIRHFLYLPRVEGIYKEFLGDEIPSSYEIERNSSLLMINNDPTLNYPRPNMPDMIDVGGMHIEEPKPLPKDLQGFATDSGQHGGFIYFSMGSILKAHMMPERTRLAFLSAFARLKQRVIWKWEMEQMENLPENVKIVKWLPQQDLLANKNIRVFITHGGLLSIQEATYHGVPILGIPMFGDQRWNMINAVTCGFALTLDFETLDETKILTALTNLLQDPVYRNRAKELSTIINDRQQTPLDRAIYWVEYVLRHHGATHLRSPRRDLNFFQSHFLDIIGSLIVAIMTIALGISHMVMAIRRRFKKPSVIHKSKYKIN